MQKKKTGKVSKCSEIIRKNFIHKFLDIFRKIPKPKKIPNGQKLLGKNENTRNFLGKDF